MSLVKQLTDEAVERAGTNADPVWFGKAFDAVVHIARRNEFLTTDDVWARIPSTTEPRALGAVMRLARDAGLILTTTEYTQSRRPECHSRPLRVWRSLIQLEGERTGTTFAGETNV